MMTNDMYMNIEMWVKNKEIVFFKCFSVTMKMIKI